MLCSNCGKELEVTNIYCPSCGRKVGAVSEIPLSAQSEKPRSQEALLPRELAIGFLIIITGAVMMLTARALVWYTVYGYEYFLLDFDDLNYTGFNWFGAVLPLVLMLVFASIAILSAIYSLATGRRFMQLWGWLSSLSVAALIANFLYLLVVYSAKEYSEDVRPHIGWVVALIGAIAIGIGTIIIGIGNKKKPHSQVALLPRAASSPREVDTGFLIIMTGAVMMLISLALDWYSVRTDMAEHFHLKFDVLSNWRWLAYSGTHWSGTTMPIIFMIAYASIIIFTAVYAVATGRRFRLLWGWLSVLSAIAIIANFLYFLVFYWDHCYVKDFSPQVGWVLALIGAIAVSIGTIAIGIGSKKKPLS